MGFRVGSRQAGWVNSYALPSDDSQPTGFDYDMTAPIYHPPAADNPADGVRPPVTERGQALGQAGRDYGYLTASFFISLISFIVVLPIFVFGIATAFTVGGLLILVGSLVVAGGFAQFQRTLAASIGFRLPRPYPVAGKGFRGKLRPMTHAQSWRELLHVLVSFTITLITFPLATSWLAGGLGGVTCGPRSRHALVTPSSGS